MERLINIALPVVLLAVLVVLALGVLALLRGDAEGQSRSNRLMRWRVALQFVAVALLALGFYWKSRAGG